MPTFRVHHVTTTSGAKDSCLVHAANPDDAANIVRNNFGSVIITKVKIDRTGLPGLRTSDNGVTLTHRQELVPQTRE